MIMFGMHVHAQRRRNAVSTRQQPSTQNHDSHVEFTRRVMQSHTAINTNKHAKTTIFARLSQLMTQYLF